MDKFKDAVQSLLESYGIPGVLILIIIFILYVAATKPENFKIYFGFLYQIVAWPFSSFRKKAIQYRIEGPTTKALKKIAKEVPDIEIPELVIKWVSEDNIESTLKEGKAIVKLRFDRDNTKNIIKATSLFVRDAFLKHTKPYLNESFKKALNLIFSKKILLLIQRNQSNLISQFFEENSIEDDEVFEKCEKIEEIDDSGLLTRILIRELNNFGDKLAGRLPKNAHKEESEEFLNFLNQIATREFDDYTPLVFANDILKVGVILVAKIETYTNYGLEPYMRRIKLGYANGIESFYLLARSEKVDILTKVANELLQTGNFILINKPQEFKDSKGRPSICYYIRINENSILANTLKDIGNSIKEKICIKGVIVSVKEHFLKLNINGVEGRIKRENLSIIEIADARLYFQEGSYIEAQPLEIQKDGVVELSLKNTLSDPNKFLTSNYEVGKKVFGIVSYIDDEFIKVDLGIDKVEGFAYRKDLTRSRFIFLHKKFHIGEEHEFEVLGYNFEKASIRLKLTQISDPWQIANHFPGESIQFLVCKKNPRAFVGEIEEGLEAILPFVEVGWTEDEINKKLQKIKLDSVIDCRIKKVDRGNNIIILSLKDKGNNPYIEFYKKSADQVFDFIIKEVTPYGINGRLVETNLDIYIPRYEMSWNGAKYQYKMGMKKKVSIKDINRSQSRLIGSFKPILIHPLQEINENFKAGHILLELKIKHAYEWGIVYTFKYKNSLYEALLTKGEISHLCWIDNCVDFLNALDNVPFPIKTIDMERNRILLSLKSLTKKNIEKKEELSYENAYPGIVLGRMKTSNMYSILLLNYWVEGILETTEMFNTGARVEVRPIGKSGAELHLTID